MHSCWLLLKMPKDPADAVSEIEDKRRREKHMEDLARKWEQKFGPDYIQSCADSHKLRDECRLHFGLPEREIVQENWSIESVPEPYRRADRLELTSDTIGYFQDDFESRLFPCREHAPKRIPFT